LMHRQPRAPRLLARAIGDFLNNYVLSLGLLSNKSGLFWLGYIC
jgi:hypothetical protein